MWLRFVFAILTECVPIQTDCYPFIFITCRAIDLAANFIGESILFSVACAAVMIEYSRKRIDDREKGQQLHEEFATLHRRIRALEEQLQPRNTALQIPPDSTERSSDTDSVTPSQKHEMHKQETVQINAQKEITVAEQEIDRKIVHTSIKNLENTKDEASTTLSNTESAEQGKGWANRLRSYCSYAYSKLFLK